MLSVVRQSVLEWQIIEIDTTYFLELLPHEAVSLLKACASSSNMVCWLQLCDQLNSLEGF